jgi:hypothetical protein
MIAGSMLRVSSAEPTKHLDSVAERTMSANSSRSAAAIEQLRAAGPAGLDAMFHVYNERIQKQLARSADKDPDWERLRAAFDTIAQQRDAYASHLYWYTNLEQAKAAAHDSGKPILSLRLLGKLNEEYSCANSRFFRTTLYPNAEVGRYLTDHFILHWQSVRPIPRITIDMGDGRRIERTITGNSVHYVLDADGNPIDALPGLYGAKAFVTELGRAISAEEQAAKLNGAERERFLVNYHSIRLAEIQQEWSADMAKINQTAVPAPVAFNPGSSRRTDAISAAGRALTKSNIEMPMLRSGAESSLTVDRTRLDPSVQRASGILPDFPGSILQQIAALHSDQSTLDSSSLRLIQLKQPPTATEAARFTASKTIVESPMLRMIRNLQHSIAEDTVYNEYQLHARIHEWFVNGLAPKNLDALNSKVYAELFLTPSSDAWLGLAPADVFSALDNCGLIQTKNQ